MGLYNKVRWQVYVQIKERKRRQVNARGTHTAHTPGSKLTTSGEAGVSEIREVEEMNRKCRGDARSVTITDRMTLTV
jgi:hypothetical protein